MDTIASIIGALIPKSVKTYLDGNKTYLVALIAAGTAAWQALGHPVPDWVYVIEAALGAGAIRVAISKAGGAYNTGALPQPPPVTPAPK